MKLASIFFAGIIICFLCFSHSDAQQVNWGYKFTKGHKYFYRYVFDQTDEQIMNDGSTRHDCFINTTDATIQIEDVLPEGNTSLLIFGIFEKRDTIHFTPFKNVVIRRPYNPAKSKLLISMYGEFISGEILEDASENLQYDTKRRNVDSAKIASNQGQMLRRLLEEFIFSYPKAENIIIGKSWLDSLYGNDKVNSITVKSHSKIKQNDPDYFSTRIITSYKIDSIIDSGAEKILKLIRNINKVSNDMHLSEGLGDEVFYIRSSDGVVIKSESTTHSYYAGIKGNTFFKTSLTLLKEE